MSRPSVGKLFFWVLAATVPVSAPLSAASISTVYDMDRILNEPHPMANEYGTRWAPLQAPASQAPRPMAPIPFTSTAPVPSASSPALAPRPALPPYIPTPKLVPVSPSAAPAPPPAAAPKPVVSQAQPPPSPPKGEVMPVLELSPRLSIDTGGLDVDVITTAPPPPPPVLPDPGK